MAARFVCHPPPVRHRSHRPSCWHCCGTRRRGGRLPLSYYEASVPVPAGWDAQPCAYLLFGPPYDELASEARERGWIVQQLPGRHLHQLVDPDGVARLLAATADQMRTKP